MFAEVQFQRLKCAIFPFPLWAPYSQCSLFPRSYFSQVLHFPIPRAWYSQYPIASVPEIPRALYFQYPIFQIFPVPLFPAYCIFPEDGISRFLYFKVPTVYSQCPTFPVPDIFPVSYVPRLLYFQYLLFPWWRTIQHNTSKGMFFQK